jgi:hypothetical protein
MYNPSITARQWLSTHIPVAMNTQRNNIRIVGCIIFWAVCVVSKEMRQLVLPRTLFQNRERRLKIK